MVALKVIAWVCFGAGGLALAGFVGSEDTYFVILAWAAAVAGVVFLALNRIVELLERIAGQKADGEVAVAADVPAEPVAVRSIADIEADLQRLKQR